MPEPRGTRIYRALHLRPHQWDTIRALLLGTKITTVDPRVGHACNTLIRQIDGPPIDVAELILSVAALLDQGAPYQDEQGGCSYCGGGEHRPDLRDHDSDCEWLRVYRAFHSMWGMPTGMLRGFASRHPIGVDLSDWSDEYVAGFLAGQVNMIDWPDNPDRDRHIAQMQAEEPRHVVP